MGVRKNSTTNRYRILLHPIQLIPPPTYPLYITILPNNPQVHQNPPSVFLSSESHSRLQLSSRTIKNTHLNCIVTSLLQTEFTSTKQHSNYRPHYLPLPLSLPVHHYTTSSCTYNRRTVTIRHFRQTLVPCLHFQVRSANAKLSSEQTNPPPLRRYSHKDPPSPMPGQRFTLYGSVTIRSIPPYSIISSPTFIQSLTLAL